MPPTTPNAPFNPSPPAPMGKPIWKYVAYTFVAVLLVGAGAAAIFLLQKPPTHPTGTVLPVARPSSSESSTTATYVKQHGLLLVGTQPNPGNPSVDYSIYTTHPDGTAKTVVTDEGGSPSWTPDGRIIFIAKRSGSQQIWIMDSDGSNAKQIGNLSASTLPVMPQEAKNGLIVFMGNDAETEPDGNTGIWMMQTDGSGLKELTRGMQPFLAFSGTWIAYTYQTDNSYHREIWRINTDGTNKKQLTFLGNPDYPDANASSISPDEQWVAFFSGKESDRMLPGAPQQSPFTFGYRNVAIVPALGGSRKTLTPCRPVTTEVEMHAATEASGNCIAADNPAWTPDGKWLIFDIGFSDGGGTWLVDMNGQNFQRFYPTGRGIERVPLIYK
jgi:Tol biopolymer transport system component